MKTIIEKRIESNLQSFVFGYWNEENQEFIPINFDNVNDVSVTMAVSPILLEGLLSTFKELVDLIQGDMSDIWKRLDKIEGKS